MVDQADGVRQGADADDAPAAKQQEIDAFLDALRQLREDAGRPSFRRMAQTAHYSHTALSGVLSVGRLPSRELAIAFVRACGGDEDLWRGRWQRVHDLINAPVPPPSPRPRRRRRLVAISSTALVAIALVAVAWAVRASSSNALADPEACDPLPAADAQINAYIDQLRQVTHGVCAGLPGLTTNRQSGSAKVADHTVTYYAQRNPDGYVQLQVNGPVTDGQPEWSAYWQENPPDNPAHPGCSWYQERVTGQPSEPSWRTTGWLCPSGGVPSAGHVPGGCDPLPASDPRINAYLDRLRAIAQPICAAMPARAGARLAGGGGQTTGTADLNGEKASYYVQRDDDGFVRLQLSGPATRTRGHPDWSVSWQQNPPSDPVHPACGWYQEQVETDELQPPWQASGWSCP